MSVTSAQTDLAMPWPLAFFSDTKICLVGIVPFAERFRAHRFKSAKRTSRALFFFFFSLTFFLFNKLILSVLKTAITYLWKYSTIHLR